jgi:class 3 adenylate cyclase/tetratricopeptide (TPR) repeat protein
VQCPACGRTVSEGAKFCPECGVPISAPEPRVEQRKTVSVLFSDVTGSTGLGERLDPESMRRVLARFFEVARSVIESHGGTVEKFIGDAVMAVFGVPVLHEDDALRAVRAAAGLKDALVSLNEDLSHAHGVTLELRTGVNTGTVVTGTEERLATGDAINVAARLQQLASPGEILLGEETVGLVRDAVFVEAMGPVELKGKSAPVGVFRLVGAEDKVPSISRRHDAPLVGRSHELHILTEAFARVVREQSSGLFTLLGAAGVGKSRLAQEFLATISATVLRGRCLSYGEGITYWPVVEVMKALLARDPDAEDLLAREREIAAGVAALFGEAEAATSSSEIAWAVRKVLERAAATRPLVVVFDDLHWGEPTLFDLIEHVTDLSRSAPIFLLCIARPELMERRLAWGGGKLNATTVLLEPLDDQETDNLIDELLGSQEHLANELRERVRRAAGGNPLFVEEMLTLATDSKTGEIEVPASVHALLAARLDQLGSKERRVLERGAVEGQSFHLGAVSALSPTEPDVQSRLVGLVRKDLIRPDRAILSGDDAFRFRHLLIRDAAYDGLAKSVRADLHVRFAHWLARAAPDLVELDEIVGYHLEQAVKYRAELGPLDGATIDIAAAASEHLKGAGLRALDRGDLPAALNLLERAAALLSEDALDVTLDLVIAHALWQTGRLDAGVARALGAAESASERGDRVGELKARLCGNTWLLNVHPSAVRDMNALIGRGHELFDQSDDDAALAYLWSAVTNVEHYQCRFGAGFDAAVRWIHHADAAGLRFLARHARTYAVSDVCYGPMPVEDALRWLSEMQRATSFEEPEVDSERAELLALAGRFEEARTVGKRADIALAERGYTTELALGGMRQWNIEAAAGNHVSAELAIRRTCDEFERMGERSWLSTSACYLAQSLYHLGRLEEAEVSARRGLELGASDDIATQTEALQVLAKVAARRGEAQEALSMAKRAAALTDRTEAPARAGNALLDLAEVHHLIGDDVQARACMEAAVEQFELKGATALVDRARRRMAEFVTEVRR